MKKRIRASEIGPGMFTEERYVLLSVNGNSYSLVVDERSLKGQDLEVQVVSLDEHDAWVELPRDTFNAGSRIKVPRSSLLPA